MSEPLGVPSTPTSSATLRDEIASALRSRFIPWTPAADEIHAYALADAVLAVPGVATALRLSDAAQAMYAEIQSPFGPRISQHHGAFEVWLNFQSAILELRAAMKDSTP